MLKFTLKKLLALIPKVLIITIICFFLLELLPGDPLSRSMSPEAYHELTEAQKDAFREARGLNDPAIVRYFRWLGDLLQGDFGISTVTGQDIGELIANRLPSTIELNVYGLIFANILGIIFGYLAAIYKNTIVDYSLNFFSVIMVSLPEFFFGISFLVIFSLGLGWFPVGGRSPATSDYTFLERIPYMVLPVLTMGTSLIAALLKYTRSSMLDVLGKDYVKTARSKGLTETKVNIKHAFRNSLPPVMTMLVMRIPRLVGGSVVIEQVFNYLGIGAMSLNATRQGDMPVALFGTIITAIMTLLASTLVDVMTAALDPRVRFD